MEKRRDFLARSKAALAALYGAHAAGTRHASAAPPVSDLNRLLSEQRIQRITSRRLRDRYARFIGKNARRGNHGRGGTYQIRVIQTDRGVRGWGMSHGADEEVRKFVGTKLSEVFDPHQGTSKDATLLDLLLHDLASKVAGLPVARLIGGRGPKQIPVYSGAIYFDDLDPASEPRGVPAVLQACRQDYEAGYRAFKLKIGRGFKWLPRKEGLRRDIEVTWAVRKHFPQCRILVDANDGFTLKDAMAYVSACADCDLYWIEEPFRENLEGLKRLKEHMAAKNCKALIADGEARTERAKSPWRYGGYSRAHIENLFALAEKKLVDVFVLDLGIVGFTNWRHVMPELMRAGVLASPHTWGRIPRPYYVAHLAAGVGNVCIVEGIPGSTDGIDYSAWRLREGKFTLPQVPGFGLRLR